VGLLTGTWEGLGYALGHPVARALVIGLGFGVMFAAVDDVALVFLAREDLHAGTVGYGVLVSVYGIGFALGALVLLRSRATAGVAISSSDCCSAVPVGCSPGWLPSLAWPRSRRRWQAPGTGWRSSPPIRWCSAACPARIEGGSSAWSARRPCLAARSPGAWAARWSTSPPPGRPS
jgi:hypothetical protein